MTDKELVKLALAFELVRATLDRLNDKANTEMLAGSTWEFRMTADSVELTEFGNLLGTDYGGFSVEGRDAEALTRLAQDAAPDA